MAKAPRTLCIDVGGTGIKLMVVSEDGKALSERLRIQTPRPATPLAVVGAIKTLLAELEVKYDRVSIGFPGVVLGGVTHTAPNLDGNWADFKLAATVAKLTGAPTRALNDAGVQGHGAIVGKGTEVVITLGTGFGFGLYVDGLYVPNIELGHHPWRKGKTYEHCLGDAALERLGKRKWNKRLLAAIETLELVFNYHALYIGGGNARKIERKLPGNVTVVDNMAGLLGGVKLWGRG
jgi:polyphosphate glucokinase